MDYGLNMFFSIQTSKKDPTETFYVIIQESKTKKQRKKIANSDFSSS